MLDDKVKYILETGAIGIAAVAVAEGILHYSGYIPPHWQYVGEAIVYLRHLISGAGSPALLGAVAYGGMKISDYLEHKLCKNEKPKGEEESTETFEMVFSSLLAATVYTGVCLCWEVGQMFGNGYSGPPRGYIQYDQLACDGLGIIAYLAVAKNAVGKRWPQNMKEYFALTKLAFGKKQETISLPAERGESQ